MPIYEYHCGKCGDFEYMQKMSDKPLTTCPTCRRKVTKLISSTTFHLKGSGWYITDYARKGQSGGPANPGASTTKSEGGSEPAGAKAAADGGTAKAENTTESRPAESSTKKE